MYLKCMLSIVTFHTHQQNGGNIHVTPYASSIPAGTNIRRTYSLIDIFHQQGSLTRRTTSHVSQTDLRILPHFGSVIILRLNSKKKQTLIKRRLDRVPDLETELTENPIVLFYCRIGI